MEQHVPVGVGLAAAVVGDEDAADDEGEVRLEAVEVESVSDAEREGGVGDLGRDGGLGRGVGWGIDGGRGTKMKKG